MLCIKVTALDDKKHLEMNLIEKTLSGVFPKRKDKLKL